MTREHYNQELADLRASVVAMASMTNKAIDNAVTALARRDVRLAEHVIAADRAINEHVTLVRGDEDGRKSMGADVV